MLNNTIIRCARGHGFDTVGTESLMEIWKEHNVIAWLGWCDKCGARVVWRYPVESEKKSLTRNVV